MATKKKKELPVPTVTAIDCGVRVSELKGGRPQSPDVLHNWMKILVDKGKLTPKEAETIEAEPTPDTVEDHEAAHTIGFKATDTGEFYIENRQIKAMFKESAVTLGLLTIYGAKHWLQTGLIVEPRNILLGRTEPDKVDIATIHVDTARGPRDSIKRSMIIENVEFTFMVKIIEGVRASMSVDNVEAMLAHAAEFVGIGADRSQGFGPFEITKFDVYPTEPMRRIDVREAAG